MRPIGTAWFERIGRNESVCRARPGALAVLLRNRRPPAAPLPDGQGIDPLGQSQIEVGEAAAVVGGEVDHHPVPDVAPFGVVVQLFGGQGHLGHEPEGLGEIGEAQFAVEFAFLQGPGG
jgi:hypothetical protein